jgi:hypothetical protein
MNIGQLKELLDTYNDNTEVFIAVSDHAEILTLDTIGQDEEYENQALVLTVSIPDDYYFEVAQ